MVFIVIPFMGRARDKFSDSELILLIQNGGIDRERALNYLYDRYVSFVFKVQKDKNISIQEAKDAYADTLISLSEQIEQNKFRQDSQLSSYLYRILSNKSVDIIRRKITNREYFKEEVDKMPGQDSTETPPDRLSLQDEVRHLTRIMDEIGGRCKQILLDWAYYGYSMEEIALRAGLKNADSAMSQKYKCFQKLKQKLSSGMEGKQYRKG